MISREKRFVPLSIDLIRSFYSLGLGCKLLGRRSEMKQKIGLTGKARCRYVDAASHLLATVILQ